MALTAAEIEAARDKAVAALRDYYSEHGDHPEVAWDASCARDRAARDAVTYAVTHGVTHRQIAQMAGVSGMAVVELIEDVDERCQAYRRERLAAEQYQRRVMDSMRTYARLLVGRHKRRKTDAAEGLGISRPTLDDWLSDAHDS